MKELMLIIRPSKAGATKRVLEEAGYRGFTCQRVQGRGKSHADEVDGAAADALVPKRIFNIIVPDEAADDLCQKLMEANRTGSHGDGRIFVVDIPRAHNINLVG